MFLFVYLRKEQNIENYEEELSERERRNPEPKYKATNFREEQLHTILSSFTFFERVVLVVKNSIFSNLPHG